MKRIETMKRGVQVEQCGQAITYVRVSYRERSPGIRARLKQYHE